MSNPDDLDGSGDQPDDEQVLDHTGTVRIIEKYKADLQKAYTLLDMIFRSNFVKTESVNIRQSTMINIFGLKLKVLNGILNGTHSIEDFLWTISCLVADIEYILTCCTDLLTEKQKTELLAVQNFLSWVKRDFMGDYHS